MALSLTNISDFTSYTSKLINDIGWRDLGRVSLQLKKLLRFIDEDSMLILMSLQKRSQICLNLFFVTWEKCPIYGNIS